MLTLSGNLAEGTPPRARRPTVSTTSGKVEKLAETKNQPQRLTSVSSPPAEIRANVDEGGLTMDKPKIDHRRIIFQFKMDEIDMRLYEGETGLEVCTRIRH